MGLKEKLIEKMKEEPLVLYLQKEDPWDYFEGINTVRLKEQINKLKGAEYAKNINSQQKLFPN